MDTLSLSLVDLRLDFAELAGLVQDYQTRLKQYLVQLSRSTQWCTEQTKQQQLAFGENLQRQLTELSTTIIETQTKTFVKNPSDSHVRALILAKKQAKEGLRTLVGTTAHLITATDWQSPTFLTSSFSQAGRQTGKIQATINDYKRDLHLDAYTYEQQFLKEYLDAPFKFPLQVYATTSGQAAFTTVLLYLIGEKKLTGPLLVGQQVYFENQWLLSRILTNACIVVAETPEAIQKAILQYTPSALILDSLSNTERITYPDIKKIVHTLHSVKQQFSLIVDNTGQSAFFQLFSLFPVRPRNFHLFGIESLNKYHQFGLDRVTGGIIYAAGEQVGKLSDYRVHAGTMISDTAALSLPTPNRTLLTKRLKRHERNAFVLATRLHEAHKDQLLKTIQTINYPGLQHQLNNQPRKQYTFWGSYFSLTFTPDYQKIQIYQTLINKVIQTAKRRNVSLVSGTSFGLDTTRIYLTALRAGDTPPFIRISAGTESLWEIETLADTLIEALRS